MSAFNSRNPKASFPFIAGLLSIAVGVVVLVGWRLGIPWIKSILPGAVEMKANTAMGLLLSGLALCLLDRKSKPAIFGLGRVLGLVVALLGIATLGEYLYGWRLGIDELLFRDMANAYNFFRGRMSPYTAVAFIALGSGLAALPSRSLRWFVWVTGTLTIVVGSTSLVGYLWRASELVTDRIVPPVAVNTASVFIVMGCGVILASRPRGERARFDLRSLSPVEIKTISGFFGAVLLLLFIGAYTYRAAVASAQSALSVAHTQQVRAELGRLYASVSDAESEERNYLLTKKQDYLQSYGHFAEESQQRLKRLGELVADNPPQVQALKELHGLINKRFELLDATTDAAERFGLAAAQAVIAGGKGPKMMESIRHLVAAMDDVEEGLLKTRSSHSESAQFSTLLSLLLTIAVAITVFMILYGGIRRELVSRTKAEKSLRRSEENLAVTLQSIGDAVLVTDTGGRVMRLNPVAEKLTGWAQAEALGKPVREVFHIINEETREPAVIPVEQVLVTGEIHGLANHTVIIARDGSERPIADSAAPIRGTDGAILGVVLVFRDVTDEKTAENALRENERRLRSLNEELEQRVERRTSEIRQALVTLDATDDGVFIFDPETLLHTYVNEGAVRQLGYTRAELLTMSIAQFNPEIAEANYRDLLTSIIGNESRTHRFTTVHRRKDGNQFPVEINLQFVAPTGNPARFIAIVRDATERQNQERMVQRTQRLESIGTLAAGVAHDLNNALAPILMGVELLKTQYPRESQLLQMIEASSKRGADMVRQLLFFAKGGEGERSPVNLIGLIRELEKLINGSFPKNIQLLVKFDPRLPLVIGDATQLHQVLLNLSVNARDAMPNGGELRLEAQCEEVDAIYASSIPDGKPGTYVVLQVRDTGTGITPEILDRIFEPFFTTKGPEKGTGLGLSTVIGIVKGHGGFLHVQSHVGKGSTFSAYLPVAETQSDVRDTGGAIKDYRGNGETILLVDDEPAVRAVARAVLQRLNFKTLTATDGMDGVVQAAQHRSELYAIITDLHMPNMDGLAFVRAIRCILPDIPIIVTSGRMDETMSREFQALGIRARIDKPFSEAELAEALRTLRGKK